MKEFKDYKIAEPAIVISSENYKVVQIKKNIDDYVSGGWLTKPIVPVQRNIVIPQDEIEKVVKEEPKKPTEQGKEAQDSPNAVKGKAGDMQKQPNNNNPNPKDNLNSNDMPSGMMMPPTPDIPKK